MSALISSPTGRTAASTPLVSVTVQIDGEPVVMLGAPTTCPQLVVVASLANDLGAPVFDGGFTLAHVPTGRLLPIWPGEPPLTPVLARYAASLVAGLDWSSADRSAYAGYGRAWHAAVTQAAALPFDHGTTDEAALSAIVGHLLITPDAYAGGG